MSLTGAGSTCPQPRQPSGEVPPLPTAPPYPAGGYPTIDYDQAELLHRGPQEGSVSDSCFSTASSSCSLASQAASLPPKPFGSAPPLMDLTPSRGARAELTQYPSASSLPSQASSMMETRSDAGSGIEAGRLRQDVST
jgi:hypothetical protein